MFFITDESELKINEGFHAVYFYSPQLLFHKKMSIMLNKVSEEHSALNIYAVDILSFQGFARRFSIDSIPTVILFKNGKEVKRIIKLISTDIFRKTFNDIYSYGELHGKKI